jgi:hypothetical protein
MAQSKGLNRNIIDKYYTKDSIVLECISIIKNTLEISNDDLIIEPSCGNGSFISGIKSLTTNYKFYDLQPENDEIENKIKFIASNINYIPFCKNRMIIGDYDYENNACTNCKIINMPWETNCEKNWVPLPVNEAEKRKLFVYKWSPYTVGFITDDNKIRCNSSIFLFNNNSTFLAKLT